MSFLAMAFLSELFLLYMSIFQTENSPRNSTAVKKKKKGQKDYQIPESGLLFTVLLWYFFWAPCIFCSLLLCLFLVRCVWLEGAVCWRRAGTTGAQLCVIKLSPRVSETCGICSSLPDCSALSVLLTNIHACEFLRDM